MEFMEGGQVNDKDYMDRNCINVSEVIFLLTMSAQQPVKVSQNVLFMIYNGDI